MGVRGVTAARWPRSRRGSRPTGRCSSRSPTGCSARSATPRTSSRRRSCARIARCARAMYGPFRLLPLHRAEHRPHALLTGRYAPAAELERSRLSTKASGSRRRSGGGWSASSGPSTERERHRRRPPSSSQGDLRQLANERDKLLRAPTTPTRSTATLKREQSRINAEVAEAGSQLATDGEKLAQAKQIIDLALDLAWDVRRATGRPSMRSARCGTASSSERSGFGTAQSRPSRTKSLRVPPWLTEGLDGGPRGTLLDGGPKGIRTPDLLAASQPRLNAVLTCELRRPWACGSALVIRCGSPPGCEPPTHLRQEI